MAGDWIKMRVDLDDDPAVIGIASNLKLNEQDVIGRLWRVWSWANKQTRDGNAPTVTEAWLDRFVSTAGFARAMQSVGWLTICEGCGIAIPKFDLHNGQSAKARALTAVRVADHRARNVTTVTESLPEKRREEKSKSESDRKAPIAATPKPSSRQQPKATWTPEHGWQGIADDVRTIWGKAYPAVDLDLALAQMDAWCRANPTKAHKSNWPRFITHWLTKEQDRGGNTHGRARSDQAGFNYRGGSRGPTAADARRADKASREFPEPNLNIPIKVFGSSKVPDPAGAVPGNGRLAGKPGVPAAPSGG